MLGRAVVAAAAAPWSHRVPAGNRPPPPPADTPTTRRGAPNLEMHQPNNCPPDLADRPHSPAGSLHAWPQLRHARLAAAPHNPASPRAAPRVRIAHNSFDPWGGGTRRRHFANPRRLRSTTSCCEDQRKHQTDASQAGSHSSTHLSHTTGRDRSRSTRVAAAAFPAAARLASLFKTTPPEPPRLTRHHGAPPRWTRRGQQALVAPAGALDKLLQQRTC